MGIGVLLVTNKYTRDQLRAMAHIVINDMGRYDGRSEILITKLRAHTGMTTLQCVQFIRGLAQ